MFEFLQKFVPKPKEPSKSIPGISNESLERLYLVNKVRDRLISHTEQLKKIGVVKVLAFGSTVKGVAHENSDLDIFVENNLDDYYLQADALKAGLRDILKGLPFKVSFFAGENKVIHITSSSKDSTDWSLDQELPKYVDEPVLLWESK